MATSDLVYNVNLELILSSTIRHTASYSNPNLVSHKNHTPYKLCNVNVSPRGALIRTYFVPLPLLLLYSTNVIYLSEPHKIKTHNSNQNNNKNHE